MKTTDPPSGSKGLPGSKLLTRQQKWQQRHPEARRAHEAVKMAIRRGDLVRQPCAECGHPRADAHHEDYSKPLVVIFLCRRHHAARHRKGGKAKSPTSR